MQLTEKQIMNRLYKDICGFEIPKNDVQQVKSSKGSPVYGEITVTSTNKLFSHVKLTNKDVLYDLGSGVGKVVLYAGLFSRVKKAIGVELSAVRHQESLLALKRAHEVDAHIAKRCQFQNADILTLDLSPASVIYTCSTAFSLDFMRKLTAHLASFTHNFRLISLQELPNTRYFDELAILRLDMSWQRATPVYIYRRNAQHGKPKGNTSFS